MQYMLPSAVADSKLWCKAVGAHEGLRVVCCVLAVAAVRLLREELQLLQEPGSYVGEVIKVRSSAWAHAYTQGRQQSSRC